MWRFRSDISRSCDISTASKQAKRVHTLSQNVCWVFYCSEQDLFILYCRGYVPLYITIAAQTCCFVTAHSGKSIKFATRCQLCVDANAHVVFHEKNKETGVKSDVLDRDIIRSGQAVHQLLYRGEGSRRYGAPVICWLPKNKTKHGRRKSLQSGVMLCKWETHW